MAKKRDKITPEMIARLCEVHFSEKVEKVTAPGGKGRDSMRVHFARRTIIATERKYPGRMRMEAEILRRLNAGGAAVPRYLGDAEGVFFQEDIGGRRLSVELAALGGQDRLEIAGRAMASLGNIHEVGQTAGLADMVPALGAEASWLRAMIGNAAKVSLRLNIPPPVLDTPALAAALREPSDSFLKWDARPGNASIGEDGRVYWFDWEHAGKRQGMEDFAWLAGDEFWPLGPDQVVDLLKGLLPENRRAGDIRYLGLFITFHIVQRLGIIRARFDKSGWADPARAMRYDRIGVDGDLIRRLCRHGTGWAGRDPLSRPMADWFVSCAETLNGGWVPPKP